MIMTREYAEKIAHEFTSNVPYQEGIESGGYEIYLDHTNGIYMILANEYVGDDYVDGWGTSVDMYIGDGECLAGGCRVGNDDKRLVDCILSVAERGEAEASRWGYTVMYD